MSDGCGWVGRYERRREIANGGCYMSRITPKWRQIVGTLYCNNIIIMSEPVWFAGVATGHQGNGLP